MCRGASAITANTWSMKLSAHAVLKQIAHWIDADPASFLPAEWLRQPRRDELPGRSPVPRCRIVERDSTSRHTIRHPSCHSQIHLERGAWQLGPLAGGPGNGRRDREFVCVDDAEAIFGGLLSHILLPCGVGIEGTAQSRTAESHEFVGKKRAAARVRAGLKILDRRPNPRRLVARESELCCLHGP